MTEKLKMQTENFADKNFAKLAELFPNAITETVDEEGNVIRAIDKDILQQEINATVVEDREERYQFTWPDKKKAIAEANRPINKTLRPCREESVDFDNTENLYIEGDNLEVLKLLQETYLGKVKMIYIDPPYNTGHDFVYQDDFAQDAEEYADNSGQKDEEGNRLFQNTERNGRFHTDWLNMMYPRLKLAKNLLTDDGVIFISIDDNEVENLRKICDEVFGESNFLNMLIWKKNSTTVMLNKEGFSNCAEYILVYKKGNSVIHFVNDPISDTLAKSYNKDDHDGRGPYGSVHLYTNTNTNKVVALKMPDGTMFEAKWQVTQATFDKYVQEGLIFKTPTGWRKKIYLSNCKGSVPINMIDSNTVGTTKLGTSEVNKLLGNVFSYPKPTDLIKYFLRKIDDSNYIILDFFSGSATTAHAVMQLNAEDGGKRKFIMVQLPEKCDEKSEAFKAGYKNICEIGKERIRRAAKKIKEENAPAFDSPEKSFWENEKDDFNGKNVDKAPKFDGGFRVLKLDESNMEDVYYTPNKTEQGKLGMFAENVKVDRTSEDLLFQVMLDLGVELSSKIVKTKIEGKEVFNVADGFLIACFDNGLDEKVITAVAKQKPQYFVTRDSSIAGDDVFTNFEQLFTTYSPDTNRKVL